ncbi:MAG: polysaccharide deacetylase [Pelosinus sp.]|jgi:peptidoglycan/xylan/chitin deacetylase (PgdA/CDA1 family)|nr:polysaccharide deacetylase [Pelosinus sp.]
MNKYLAFGALFLVAILGWLFLPTNAVPMLAYHQVGEVDDIYSVTPGQFEEQMEYLQKNGYHAISLEELFDFYEGKGNLPAKPIIITFDDGYADNYLTALPILEKYNLSATVFIVPSLMGTVDYLSWEQVVEMQKRHTEIGSHTMSHIGMNEISAAEQKREAVTSKTALEQQLGKPIHFFAYPYGQFSTTSQQILKETGYKGACSGIPGLNDKNTNSYALKRINVPQPKYGLWEFRLRLLRAHLYSKLGL